MTMQISGEYTDDNWNELKPSLVLGATPDLWQKAYEQFFKERLETRYFLPVRVLSELEDKGEGFSIVAIQCSLIEFLESTIQGKRYVLGATETDKVYGSSRKMFKSFLLKRRPFKDFFPDDDRAQDFYESVRCGLLHEARTKKTWKIWAGDGSEKPIVLSPTKNIVFRRSFQKHLELAIEIYREKLMTCEKLQQAFIDKVDTLCDITS